VELARRRSRSLGTDFGWSLPIPQPEDGMAETTQTSAMSQPRSALPPAERILGGSKDLGAELMAAVRDSANALFEEQRDRAANEIAALGEVLHRAVESLNQPGGPYGGYGIVARGADEAAREINGFAARLRSRSWGELSRDIEDFARRYPMAFIGTAAALGFVAYRFMAAAPADASGQPGFAAIGSGGAYGSATAGESPATASGAASGFGAGAIGETR
jgi:hypothetical protein